MPDTPTPDVPEWDWPPGEQTCTACSTTHPIAEQPPDELARGVVWECPTCGARNQIGGPPPPGVAPGTLMECPSCGRTFTSDSVVQPDGDSCPSCGGMFVTVVTAGETATISQHGGTA